MGARGVGSLKLEIFNMEGLTTLEGCDKIGLIRG